MSKARGKQQLFVGRDRGLKVLRWRMNGNGFAMRVSRTLRATAVLVLGVVLGQLPAVPAAAQLNQQLHMDGWILAAAHAPGLQESIWRTDLWIVKDKEWADVSLTFCRQSTDNTNAVEHEVVFGDDEIVVYLEDVVDTYLGIGDGSWTGAIHYTSTEPIQVWARVYSVSADGTESYGQLINGIPTADMSPDSDPWDYTEQQYLYAVKHTADDRFRVNIGVVNPTSIEAAYTVRILNPDGNCRPGGCGTYDVVVPPFSMVQRTDPFGEWQGGAWSKVVIQAWCDTEGGGYFLYASAVDNATNDAFFVNGIKRKGPAD